MFQQQLSIGLLYINNCQYLHRLFGVELTGKATPHFVKRPWSISVTALYTIVVYHQLSGSSSNIWNGNDRKSNSSVFWMVVKCFSNSFVYGCCISSFVRILIDYFKKSKKRWQEERHLNLSKGAWKDSVTALYTIVVYHQLSGSSSRVWNRDDRKSDTSICRKGMKCFSNNFI